MKTFLATLTAFIFLPSSFVLAQGGPLTPTGAPAPTMKTLEEIEPRINLSAAPASAVTTSDASYHYIINEPGSYYLSGNLTVTKTTGIQINAVNVTLDLNGFQLFGSGTGIEIPVFSHGATVKNGSIQSFAYGIRSLLSATSYAKSCAFRDLTISGCTTYGIFTGHGAVLEACRAYANSGTAAIYANAGSTLSNCAATSNSVNYGIYADNGSTLTNCTARANGSSAATSAGIGTGEGCTIRGCNAYSNASSAVSSPTTGMGFSVGGGSMIENCTAKENEGDGINVVGDTLVRANSCSGNGAVGNGAGIHATSTDNRIEGNNVTDNVRGIDIDLQGNVIFKNSAAGNTTFNYDIAANNVFGTIVDCTAPASAAVTGSSAASTAGSTDPWANFAY